MSDSVLGVWGSEGKRVATYRLLVGVDKIATAGSSIALTTCGFVLTDNGATCTEC
jgi:hypothetical protein